MSESLSIKIGEWKKEAFVRTANEVAVHHMDRIGFDKLKQELHYYLTALIDAHGEHVIQPKRAEGPEDIPVLLHAVQLLVRYKARIRAIALDMATYERLADQHFDIIKKTLAIKEDFTAVTKTKDDKETIARLVASDLVRFKDQAEEIVSYAKVVGAEYSDAFNAIELEFRMVNAMNYQRGLHNASS